MTALEFAAIIGKMTDTEFDEFLAALPPVITEEDKKVMIMQRGLQKLLTDASYFRAMCTALGEQLYSEFNAMPREDEQGKRQPFTTEMLASVRMW